MPILTETNIDYLIDSLRLHLGDIDHASYRYLDEWLRSAVVYSIKSLQKWWNNRYLLDSDSNVYRNPNIEFLFDSPPIIQTADERPIILMASIYIKSGTLENNAWNVGSWRDAEVAYSNIEGARQKEFSLKRDIDELNSILSPPRKRLAQPVKGHLPGYLGNVYERKDNE